MEHLGTPSPDPLAGTAGSFADHVSTRASSFPLPTFPTPTSSRQRVATPPTYSYPTLAAHQIRLLRPTHDASSRDLRFEVSTVLRQAAPTYTALSYTWGDQKPTKIIHLDGKPFYIRPNLWSSLFYLSAARLRPQIKWDWIWVDAICINQKDNDEKSIQVASMGQIYANAQAVSVWLGLVPYPEHLPPPEEYTNGSILTHENDGFEWLDQLSELLNRAYWSRVWVIQEFLLATQVHFYCSNHITDDLFLREFLEHETGIRAPANTLDEDPSFSSILDTVSRTYSAAPLLWARHLDMFPEYGSSLQDLLIRHRNAMCQDPRDRVFALVGLLPRDEATMLKRFFPNYSFSEDQVVIIALAHVLHFGSTKGLPTVTVRSDDLWKGLGVLSGRKRDRILSRAKDFDYCDDWAGVDVPRTLSRNLWLFDNDTSYSDDGVPDTENVEDVLGSLFFEREVRPRSTRCTAERLSVICMCAAVIWIAARKYL